jgi:hypothetical protein
MLESSQSRWRNAAMFRHWRDVLVEQVPLKGFLK